MKIGYSVYKNYSQSFCERLKASFGESVVLAVGGTLAENRAPAYNIGKQSSHEHTEQALQSAKKS